MIAGLSTPAVRYVDHDAAPESNGQMHWIALDIQPFGQAGIEGNNGIWSEGSEDTRRLVIPNSNWLDAQRFGSLVAKELPQGVFKIIATRQRADVACIVIRKPLDRVHKRRDHTWRSRENERDLIL